jgi:hypothetical protein
MRHKEKERERQKQGRDREKKRKKEKRQRQREKDRDKELDTCKAWVAQLVPDNFVVHLWPLPWPGKFVDQPWPDEIFL